jgi:antagonist of KipI
MDHRSHVIANRLVGNRDQAATLEITLKGPELLFEQAAVIAVTGADLSPAMDSVVLPLWTSVQAKAGSRLMFGARHVGARCYLAIAGGIEVPVVLGSRSTYVSARTGGLNGRALAAGDRLIGGAPDPRQRAMIGYVLPERLRPIYSTTAILRILPGPQRSLFTPQAFDLLTGNPYRLSSQSDRMGYRLEGAKLTSVRAEARISDGTALGALQVPPDGQPILLMADRHTTGGYPIVAVLISADLHLAGQLLPGESVSFAPTTLSEACAILKEQREEIDRTIPPRRGSVS